MTAPTTSLPQSAVEEEFPAVPRLEIDERQFKKTCVNVLEVQVEALEMRGALTRIHDALVLRRKGYICMAGVHGIMEAQRNSAVRCAFAGSLMSLPDGTPTVWVGRWQGYTRMGRVTGPDLMVEVFRSRLFAGHSHFFYGGKPGVAQELASNLKQRFPWLRISGTYTPPFRDLNQEEERDLIATVRLAKPSIIWVGISTPRQELFMRKYLPVLETSLMFGVGAAFDFHTGRIKDSAEWIKRAGLQWLHRLVQDPRHLFWRYLRNNPAFLWRIFLQLAGFDAHAQHKRRMLSADECCLPCEPSSEPCRAVHACESKQSA
jgi:N-acetylglucosaminyldiphosphoundecaprenol N-acetyl-beta-D-mannosaminyltransferase